MTDILEKEIIDAELPLTEEAPLLQKIVEAIDQADLDESDDLDSKLPDMGGGCAIIDDPSGEEYYDCSFDCVFEANYPEGQEYQWQCDVISENSCALNGNFDRYNFFSVLFCSFSGNIAAYVIVSVIIIFLIMKFISATVEDFVCPGITYMSEKMKMSESLAAVTLVALANGAGDVITALVAGSSAGGVSYNIGSLYGSGFFVCSMVISMTILGYKPEKPGG